MIKRYDRKKGKRVTEMNIQVIVRLLFVFRMICDIKKLVVDFQLVHTSMW